MGKHGEGIKVVQMDEYKITQVIHFTERLLRNYQIDIDQQQLMDEGNYAY